MRFLITILFAIMCGYVTSTGFQHIINYFTGKYLGLWDIYLLSIAYTFMRYDPFNAREVTKRMSDSDYYARLITALFVDCIAVYLIIPAVLK